jgi:formylglycine-generating enzyme required for sulfatase activity
LLADRAAVWNARPENRQLPSVPQWVSIRLLTRKKNWTDAQRKMMRRATFFHALRGLIIAVLAAVAGWGGYEGYGSLKAHALRDRLLNADTTDVPAVVWDMAPFRRWIDPLLRDAYREAEACQNVRKQLHAGLALLPADPDQVDYLYERLHTAQPHEVPVLLDALAPHKGKLLDKLWNAAERPDIGPVSQRLTLAAALARYDADGPRWAKLRDRVADDLVRVPAVHLAAWMEDFHPVRGQLRAPLAVLFRDSKRRETERSVATDFLADYAADQPLLLAELLLDADEKQFAVLFPKLRVHRETALPLLDTEVDRRSPPGAGDDAKVTLAKRRANAAVALLRLGHDEKVWPLLKHSPDPTVRSYLIHRLGPLGADVRLVLRRLQEEADATLRRALMLSLGEFGEEVLSPGQRDGVVKQLQDTYRTADDPGLRAAADWLLRHWKQDRWLKQEDAAQAKDAAGRKRRIENISQAIPKAKGESPPQWYVNGQGQTMVVLPGPIEFDMGSPLTEAGRSTDEPLHKRRIGRTFAFAAKLVTVEEFLRFRKGHAEFLEKRYARTADCPAHAMTWHEAAEYCNWLSAREGIPAEQWCYETDPQGRVTKPKAGYLSRTGYRLPTEAEAEYACRAGTATARYYGSGKDLLKKYGWYADNSAERSWPVGDLKPNDLGFFDMHGNLWCWCQERYLNYPQATAGEVIVDKEDQLNVNVQEGRVVRGGSFPYAAWFVRSAYRDWCLPEHRNYYVGLRPARTFP